jgi:hypothetical protein
MSKNSKAITPNWNWCGYEIHGNHQIDTKRLLRSLPKRRLGRRIDEDTESLVESAGERLQTKFRLPQAQGRLVRLIDRGSFKAIGVIDVVEKGDEHRCSYRTINGREITLANNEILAVYNQLSERRELLFNQGTPPYEIYSSDFLDLFNDSECHQLCLQLSQLVPAYRKNILEVVEYHHNELTRATAANLLCWTRFELEGAIAATHWLLDDPSDEVRNNISRFMLPYVDRIYGAHIKHPLIHNLLVQLNRPSHVDRNKALYCLLAITKRSGFLDRRYIKERGSKLIERVASTSLLPNVRQPAQDILALLKC